MENTEQIAQQKAMIIKKAGLKPESQVDYKIISQKIFLETKNFLSESTIKNIFQQNRKLESLFVLNSLAQFLDYPSGRIMSLSCKKIHILALPCFQKTSKTSNLASVVSRNLTRIQSIISK